MRKSLPMPAAKHLPANFNLPIRPNTRANSKRLAKLDTNTNTNTTPTASGNYVSTSQDGSIIPMTEGVEDVSMVEGIEDVQMAVSSEVIPVVKPKLGFQIEFHVPEESKFAQFRKFPLEVKQMIWSLVDQNRTVTISLGEEQPETGLRALYFSSNPVILRVNRESRFVGLSIYQRSFRSALIGGLFFNFLRDELFFDSRRALVAFCEAQTERAYRYYYHRVFEHIMNDPTEDEKNVRHVGIRYRAHNERYDNCPRPRIEASNLPSDIARFSGAETVRIVLDQKWMETWYNGGKKVFKPERWGMGGFLLPAGMVYENPQELRSSWQDKFKGSWDRNFIYPNSSDPKPLPEFMPDFQNLALDKQLVRSRSQNMTCFLEMKHQHELESARKPKPRKGRKGHKTR